MIPTEKIQELRQQLRDERRATDGAARSDRDHDLTGGTSFQAARGKVDSLSAESRGDDQDRRTPEVDQRSAATIPVGKRPRPRRPGPNHGDDGQDHSAGAGKSRAVGNLETDEPVRERLDTKPKATFEGSIPKNAGKVPRKSPKFPKMDTWTVKEADEKKIRLGEVLSRHFEDIDELLWNRETAKFGSSNKQPVWTDLDEEDIGQIAEAGTRLAQRHGWVAEGMDLIIDSDCYISSTMLLWPRLKKTVEVVRKTYIPRKGRMVKRDE